MNADDLRSLKSESVKAKIRGARLTPKMEKYIEELIRIEKGIQDGLTSWGAAAKSLRLSREYKTDYIDILQELNPAAYQNELQLMSDAEKVKNALREKRMNRMGDYSDIVAAWEEMGGRV